MIVITPKYRSFLKPIKEDHSTKTVTMTRKWLFIGYENELPFILSQGVKGLNFPIEIKPEIPLHIGSLDIDKRPMMDEKRVEEVQDFLRVKRLYDESKNSEVAAAVDTAITRSKESLFLPELLVYKLRTLALGQGHEHTILDIGKLWSDTYTSHKDLPEVMLLVAKANIDLGYTKDANYYIDTLINDYSDSLYSQMAMIYKADRFKNSAKAKEASELYLKVLKNTTDMDIASIAATKMAELLISSSRLEEGVEYYKKVFRSNPGFFVKEVMKGYELALFMASFSEFSLAAGLSDSVLGKLDKTHAELKNILLSNARWHAQAGSVDVAKERYERYLNLFPYEADADSVKREYDELFFALRDDNVTSKLTSYEGLIEKYGDDEIGEKAFYEKVLLLAEEHRFDEVKETLGQFTQLESGRFPDIEIESAKLVNDMFFYYLIKEQCGDVVFLYKNYDVSIDSIYDEKIYNCLFDTFEYRLALDICDKNTESASGHFTIEWIGRKVDIYDRISESKRVEQFGEDYLKAMTLYGKPVSLERYMKILRAQSIQKEFRKVLDTADRIETAYPNASNRAEVYDAALRAALKLQDFPQALQYAEKLNRFQERASVTVYTPWAEITYADLLSKRKRYHDAVAVLQSLLQKELKPSDRAQALYTLSSYLDLLGMFDTSKAVLARCVGLKSEDKFSRLCNEAMEILGK
jgi:tetratricopeptide (TPR) repeat protein